MEWRDDCQNRFNGMWAILIWDNLEKRLWISRDRFGVKPLYYMIHPEFFVVSSEIKCILPLTTLDPYLQEIYAYLVDGPSDSQAETFFKNVYRFPAGHCTNVSTYRPVRELQINKYFDLEPPNLDKDFSKKRLREYAGS